MDADNIKDLKAENQRLKEHIACLEKKLDTPISWHRTILNSIPYPIFVKDQDHVWVDMNSAFCELLEKSHDDLIGKNDYDFISKEQADIFWEKDSEVLVNNTTNWNEEELTVNGNIRKLLTAKVRIEDEDGNYFVLGIISDISDSQNNIVVLENKNSQIQEQKKNIEILLKEVHHRVKNNLQIVHSLLGLQMGKFEDESLNSAFQDSRNRILAMASVHQMLYITDNVAQVNIHHYLTSIITKLNSSFPHTEKRNISTSIERLFVDPDIAVPIGLIVNEIFTNAIKHFNNHHDICEIYIRLNVHEDNFTLEMGDNGPGFPDNTNIEDSESLGFELIMLLIDQLEATIEYPPSESGVHYKIVCPVKKTEPVTATNQD